MNAKFFAAVRASLFNGKLSQAQVDGLNAIGRAFSKYGDGDGRKLAYLLATAFHETAFTMEPVRETLANTDALAKSRLTRAWKAGKLKWVKRDYWSGGYFGRGFVQLTHQENYQRAKDELGYDFVGKPHLALDATLAAQILVKGCMEGWFTGKKLGDFKDFKSMRKVVNGTDKATAIAGYAEKFLKALA